MDEIHIEQDCDSSVPHFHNEMEIMYVLSGRTAIMSGGANFVLEPEEFVVWNPFEHHEIYRDDGNHTLSFYISIEVLQQAGIGNIKCCSALQQEQKDYLLMLRIKLALLYKHYHTQSDESRSQILSQLFGLLSILKREFETSESASFTERKDADLIQRVLRYVGEHYTEDISLQKTADKMFLSKGHLSRKFQERMGIPFSDYLRTLRLNKAVKLLEQSDKSVIDIAMECGFSNVNTMILNFRKIYGCTPGAYCEQHLNTEEKNPEAFSDRTISYMNLLKYVGYEESFQPLNKKKSQIIMIKADAAKAIGTLKLCQREIISVGWASSLLQENTRNALRRAKKEIGFQFVFFHGMLDESMDVYHETSEGTPWFSFTYVDMILDFLAAEEIYPLVEFSYTPPALVDHSFKPFGDSCIELPTDLEKWKILVEGVMSHLLDRYGHEMLLQWKFTPSSALYMHYHVFSLEDYLDYYETTCSSIREAFPEAHIVGCTFETGYLLQDGMAPLERFLDFCFQKDCMPDSFSFQCIQCDYSSVPREETEKKISAKGDIQSGEPAPISTDSDYLKHNMQAVRSVLKRYQVEDKPILIISWNSTHWQRDLGNDTCFKAAFIVKNFPPVRLKYEK